MVRPRHALVERAAFYHASDDSTATFVVVCMFPGTNHFTKLILELNFNTKLQFKREAECQISFGICISI